jgi:hypothetical protein
MALMALNCAAAPQSAIVGSVSSTRPIGIGDVAMTPTGSASWPVVEGDEIATDAAALFTTTDREVVTLDGKSNFKLGRAGAGETYIFVRKGGLTFDAKSGRTMVCAGGHLFVPQARARGVLRLDSGGSVSEQLDSGAFTENGVRACDETGPMATHSPLPGPAGAVIPAAPSHAGVNLATAAAIIAGGAGVAAGVTLYRGSGSSASNSCADTGCNTNPAPVSVIQP